LLDGIIATARGIHTTLAGIEADTPLMEAGLDSLVRSTSDAACLALNQHRAVASEHLRGRSMR
jgi:hypothetical protein